MLDFAGRKSAIQLADALRTVVQAGRSLTRLTGAGGMLLLPTTPQTAFPMDGAVPPNQADFTALANMNGAPAISLPLPVEVGLLPVGMQLIGRRGRDADLLEAAARLQQALAHSSGGTWAAKWPAICSRVAIQTPPRSPARASL